MKNNDSLNSPAEAGSNAANADIKQDRTKVSRGTNFPKRPRKIRARDSERKMRNRNDDAKSEVARFERRVLKSAIPEIVKWIADRGYFPTRRKRHSKSNSEASSRPVEEPVQDCENNTAKANDTSAPKSDSETSAGSFLSPSAPSSPDIANPGPTEQNSERTKSGPGNCAGGETDGDDVALANTNVTTSGATLSEATEQDLFLASEVATQWGAGGEAPPKKRKPRVPSQPSGATEQIKTIQTEFLDENKN